MDQTPPYQTGNQIITFFDGGGSFAAPSKKFRWKKIGKADFLPPETPLARQEWRKPILPCHPYLTFDY
ncbi:MAG: hypothetical protein R2788_01475 [Saprospiraceae bacterium]